MKLTWTFYPRFQASVTLTVFYMPSLDEKKKAYLHVETNTVYACREVFLIFDRGDLKTKKMAFEALTRIEQPLITTQL